jgi:Domain of unknown function (DU1801)
VVIRAVSIRTLPREVAEVFSRYESDVRRQLLRVRGLIFEVAARTPGVGQLTEALRWGQPAYLTEQSRSGSLIRIDAVKGRPDKIGMFFHCQTSLVGTFRALYEGTFEFDGNRCLLLAAKQPMAKKELAHCIELALTYHLKH